MATRCCCPPLSSSGLWSSLSPSYIFSKSILALSKRFLVPIPEGMRGYDTFSQLVSLGMRWKSWKIKPIFSRRNLESAISENEVISSPDMNTLPFVGLSRVPRIFSRVVFPEPEGPCNTTKLFLLISRLIFCMACTSWRVWQWYDLDRFSVLIIISSIQPETRLTPSTKNKYCRPWSIERQRKSWAYMVKAETLQAG